MESEEDVTLLRQPLGSEVVLAATQSRNLIMWRYEPFAAFRTFMASGGGYGARYLPSGGTATL